MLTATIFFIVLAVLVFVHEAGHFWFAKRAGMQVDEFGFGFPPRLWSFKKGETVYSINWIPFGGFVKVFGESGEDHGPRSFNSVSLGRRALMVVGGVLMNFLLAATLLVLVNFLGLRIGLAESETDHARDLKVQVLDIAPGSPAAAAGLQPLDTIKGYIQDSRILLVGSVREVQTAVATHIGRPLTFQIIRNGESLIETVIPRQDPPEGQGALGISLALTGEISYPWYEALWRGIYDAVILTANTTVAYYQLLKTLLVHGKLMADVSGPIGIATLTGQAARVGVNYLLQFVAMISVNLAVLNIIPFPALDGGRLAMLGIEKLKGSPIHYRAENIINLVGFYSIVALLLYVTYQDINRFFNF